MNETTKTSDQPSEMQLDLHLAEVKLRHSIRALGTFRDLAQDLTADLTAIQSLVERHVDDR